MRAGQYVQTAGERHESVFTMMAHSSLIIVMNVNIKIHCHVSVFTSDLRYSILKLDSVTGIENHA